MDKYYITMAQDLAKHSHCLRRKVGAVLVSSDGFHIVTAVNNPFPSLTACAEKGCLREQFHIPSGTQSDVCRCIHCEMDVILQCAKHGIPSQDSTVYTTLYPCFLCAKALVVAGVKRVVYSAEYPDTRAKNLFAHAQIQVDQL